MSREGKTGKPPHHEFSFYLDGIRRQKYFGDPPNSFMTEFATKLFETSNINNRQERFLAFIEMALESKDAPAAPNDFRTLFSQQLSNWPIDHDPFKFIKEYSIREYGSAPEGYADENKGESRLGMAQSMGATSEGMREFEAKHPEYFQSLAMRKNFVELLRMSFGPLIHSYHHSIEDIKGIFDSDQIHLYGALEELFDVVRELLANGKKDEALSAVAVFGDLVEKLPEGTPGNIPTRKDNPNKQRVLLRVRELHSHFDELWASAQRLRDEIQQKYSFTDEEWKVLCDSIRESS